MRTFLLKINSQMMCFRNEFCEICFCNNLDSFLRDTKKNSLNIFSNSKDIGKMDIKLLEHDFFQT